MNNKHLILLALFIPILVLAGLAIVKRKATLTGKVVTLEIKPMIPRSLLSGNYLRYKIEYKAKNICYKSRYFAKAYICLQPKSFFTYQRPIDLMCSLYLQGKCSSGGKFSAGIERFYIPQAYSSKLKKVFRDKKLELVLKVSPNGSSVVTNLLIGGVPWRDVLER